MLRSVVYLYFFNSNGIELWVVVVAAASTTGLRLVDSN